MAQVTPCAQKRKKVQAPQLSFFDNRFVRRILVIGLLIMTATTTLLSSDRQRDDGNALVQMEREWNEALKTHDIAWFEKNLADDFTDISSGNGALSTKAEDVANLKTDKTVYESLELSDLHARVEGNAGLVTGVNHIKGRSEAGDSFEVRLSFTDTYIKRHGRWQAWASQHTRIR